MIGGIVAKVVGALVGPTADIVGNWQARKASAQEQRAKWETVQAGADSWKDELWTLIFAFPLVGAFIPYEPLQASIRDGWTIIAESPDWYIAGLGLAWSAAFATRGFRLIRNKKGQIVPEYGPEDK